MTKPDGKSASAVSTILWVCSALLVVSAVVSSARFLRNSAGAGRSRKSETCYRLRILRECLVECHKRGHDLKKLRSVSELLWAAQEEELILRDTYLEKTYEGDAWHRPFRWSVFRGVGYADIWICSDGANGIPEGGLGDDIYVRVRVTDSGELTEEFGP